VRNQQGRLDRLETAILFLDEWKKQYSGRAARQIKICRNCPEKEAKKGLKLFLPAGSQAIPFYRPGVLMHKPSIGLSLEGLPFIFLTAIATLTFAIHRLLVHGHASSGGAVLRPQFFRDPERVVPQNPGVAVSPADGKVIKVETMRDPLTGEDRTAICVFMNVFNVHVNRMPVAGRIARISYFGASSSMLPSTRRPLTTNVTPCWWRMRMAAAGPWCRSPDSSRGASSVGRRRGDTLARGTAFSD
jgi:Phosphatidylserine decarboxylase